MLKEYPAFKREGIWTIFEAFPSAEKDGLEKYIEYRIARGCNTKQKQDDIKRIMVQLRHLHQRDLGSLTLEGMRSMLAVIRQSSLSDYHKNEVMTNLRNYLKWRFKDWSMRFGDFEDVKLIRNPVNKVRPVDDKNLTTREDIAKLMKHETSMFWKAFLITQWEGCMRTGEARTLKWSDIRFNVDGDISEISIFASKVKRPVTKFVKEATFYLQKLREEQENTNTKGVYVFHSRVRRGSGGKVSNAWDAPVDRATISNWMRSLTRKTFGQNRRIWNYLLRHQRATELYTLANEGKISDDTAARFAGHSKSMKDTYLHLDSKKLKSIIREQVYKLEDLPPERKTALEKEVSELRDKLKELEPLNRIVRKLRDDPKFLKLIGLQ